MMTSHAFVPTDKASRYLQQLCRHFAHKLAVEVSPDAGSVAFPYGVLRAQRQEELLRLTVEAADEANLAQLEDVAARHLARFMFREEPTIAWTREPPQTADGGTVA